jgi:hypothetical protein
MSVGARLAGFAAVLALVFVAAFGLGRTVGPVDPSGPTGEPTPGHSDDHPDGHAVGPAPVEAGLRPGGAS